MKRTAFLLFFPIYLFSQSDEMGHLVNDTLFLTNGARFVIGQKLKLGYGSSGHKDFRFIHLSPWSAWSIGPPQKLGAASANHEMVVKKFIYERAKEAGKTWYVVVKLKGGNLTPYWCEIVAAMDNGEVIVAGINDKKTLAAANTPKVDVADELAKLNKLYKESILTKDEYEVQKKKILSQ